MRGRKEIGQCQNERPPERRTVKVGHQESLVRCPGVLSMLMRDRHPQSPASHSAIVSITSSQ